MVIKIRQWFPLFGFLALMACSDLGGMDQGVDDGMTEKKKGTVLVSFHSEIRPELDSFDLSATYVDTLVFKFSEKKNDEYYAWFGTFDNKTVTVVCDEIVEDNLKGSTFKVEWKVDSIGRFDNGEQQSYCERLVRYEVLQPAMTFIQWLNDGFIADLRKKDRKQLRKYIHPDQPDSYTAHNPGAFCIVGGEYEPYYDLDFGDEFVVNEGLPDGHFCDGYPNTINGVYFVEISKNELPRYYDMTGDFDDNARDYTPELPAKEAVDRIMKVAVIVHEFIYNHMYFVQIRGQYYLWIEDYCDCSA